MIIISKGYTMSCFNHAPPYTAEVKNKWSYTSFPPTSLYGVHKENFTCLPALLWISLGKIFPSFTETP
jgi:hypothetical protein